MTQTRWQSFVEVNARTAVGLVVSWAATPFIMAAFGYEAGAGKALGITIVYTLLSLARGWAMRRVFNRLHGGGAMTFARIDAEDDGL